MKIFLRNLFALGLLTLIISSINFNVSFSQISDSQRDQLLKEAVEATVLEVIDPIHLRVDIQGKTKVVRLLGCENPSKDVLKEANKETQRFTLGQTVFLTHHTIGEDNNGNDLVMVYYADGWFLLNASLIDRGYAQFDDTYPVPFEDELRQLQRQAQMERKGMWRLSKGDLNRLDERSNESSTSPLESTKPDHTATNAESNDSQKADSWPAIYAGINWKQMLENNPTLVSNLANFSEIKQIQNALSHVEIDMMHDIETVFIMVSSIDLKTPPSLIVYISGTFDQDQIAQLIDQEYGHLFEKETYHQVPCLISKSFNKAPSLAFIGDHLISISTPEKVHEAIDRIKESKYDNLFKGVPFSKVISEIADESNQWWISIRLWPNLKSVMPHIFPGINLNDIELLGLQHHVENKQNQLLVRLLCKNEKAAQSIQSSIQTQLKKKQNAKELDSATKEMLESMMKDLNFTVEGKQMKIQVSMDQDKLESIQDLFIKLKPHQRMSEMDSPSEHYGVGHESKSMEPDRGTPKRHPEPALKNKDESSNSKVQTTHRKKARNVESGKKTTSAAAKGTNKNKKKVQKPKKTTKKMKSPSRSFDSSIPAEIVVVPEEETEANIPDEAIFYDTSDFFRKLIDQLIQMYREPTEWDEYPQPEESDWNEDAPCEHC